MSVSSSTLPYGPRQEARLYGGVVWRWCTRRYGGNELAAVEFEETAAWYKAIALCGGPGKEEL